MDQDLVGAAAITLEDTWRQDLVIHTKAAGVILDGATAILV